jgi:hypothetical protein
MRIRRDGRIYDVIYKTKTEYVVSLPFTYSEKPCVRNQTLWWDKKLCTEIKDEHEED